MKWQKYYRITLSEQKFETRTGLMFDWDEFWIADNGDYRTSELGTSQAGPVALYGGYLLAATPRVEQQLAKLRRSIAPAAKRLQRRAKQLGLATIVRAFQQMGK